MRRLRGIAVCVAAAAAAFTFTAVAAGAGSAPPSPRAKAAANAARTELGVAFQWGGVTPETGFDDSGLVVWAFAQAGVHGLPHFSGALWMRGVRIPRSQLQPGDLVFFNHAGHVAIYIGHGKYIDAPHTGQAVRVAPLGSSTDYTGAVRIR